MRRIFAILMALVLLATACSSSGSSTEGSSGSVNDETQSTDTSPAENLPAGDKLVAAPIDLGEAPDDLAWSNWSFGSGSTWDDSYSDSHHYSWDTGFEELEYSQPVSNATDAEWIKVFSLTGGLRSGDYAGAAEFSSGEVGDTYCLEYGDHTPHFSTDNNLHRITGAGDLSFSLTNGQVDTIEKIMDAYNDSTYWNGSSYSSGLYDGIASAIWSVTDGHGLNNSIAADIMAKVQDGTYMNNASSLYWARSDDSGIQDQLIIVPPGDGPETAPPEIPFVEPTGGCQVQLFDFPFGDGLLGSLGVGEYNLSGDLAWLNDDIESVYVPAGMSITVSEHMDGDGWTKFREGPGTFEVHDDQVSWIKIEGSCNSTPVPQPTPVPTPPPASGDCQIDVFDFPEGETLLSSFGVGEYNLTGDLAWLNDDIESITVPAGMTITVSEHVDGQGWTKVRQGPGTFWVHDDEISWIKVEGSCDPATPTATPEPAATATSEPRPTATTVPPRPTATTVPPRPTATTVPPRPTATTVPPRPTATAVPALGSLGDYVWFDENRDGIQGNREDGIPNVLVGLFDGVGVLVNQTTTDVNGGYLFENLAAGTYTVSIDTTSLPDGFEQTYDVDGFLDHTSSESLAGEETNLTHDFGYAAPDAFGSIGDFVWYDTDADGVRDTGEAGIPDITLELRTATGRVLDTQVTAGNGAYLFEDLEAGSYTVLVVASSLPRGFEQTFDLDGTLDNTSIETLDSGENNRQHDFGYVGQPAVIASAIWLDADGDGVQDANEDGIAGVTVIATAADGTVAATDTTGSSGVYLLEDLPAGCYTIEVVASTLPAGASQTFDADGTLDNTAEVCLDPGQTDAALDFGYIEALASIGDYVWLDADADGVQDSNEDGIDGVAVALSDDSGSVIATDITDINGLYLFEDLTAGCYNVEVVTATLPAGMTQTFDEDGTLDNASSECLDPGENDRDQDFGYVEVPGSIGATVWMDADSDGVPDATEDGISGVTVTATDEDGTLAATDVTNSNGEYLFEDLAPGCYTITISTNTLPAGAVQTFDEDGTLDNTSNECIDPGENSQDQDFGYVVPASIGDYVWLDFNGNRSQDPFEVGIPNVTLELRTAAGTLVTTDTTDATGQYLFDDLAPGCYTVTVDTSTLPPFVGQTFDEDGTLDHTSSECLDPGEDDRDQDFGYVVEAD